MFSPRGQMIILLTCSTSETNTVNIEGGLAGWAL